MLYVAVDMGMISDKIASSIGLSSFRYSIYVDNCKILKIFKDEDSKFDVSNPGI